jgi:hypothetical protein
MAIAATRHTPSTEEPAPRLLSWAVRGPLTAFLVLTFSLAYTLVAVVHLAHRGTIPGREVHGKATSAEMTARRSLRLPADVGRICSFTCWPATMVRIRRPAHRRRQSCRLTSNCEAAGQLDFQPRPGARRVAS